MIRQEKASIGHHIKDLVKECTFRGVDCLASLGGEDSLMTYSRFLTPKFGNCFTIYAEQEMLGRSSMTGAAYGLSLVLNIEQETYLRGGATSMVILLSLLQQFLHNVYFCLRSRPVSPNVVRVLVSQSVSDNVENKSDGVTE